MAEEKKSESKQLKEKLFASKKHGALRMSEDDQTACEALCKDYMAFLNQSKTEREACANAEALLKEHGFVPFTPGMALKAGDKVYQNNRGKAMIAAIIGSAPITEGVRLCAAHIDSPRLDMKQNPLYEDSELGLFKTHYYGGIKKYQWTAIPLSLHGVIIKADGSKVTGEQVIQGAKYNFASDGSLVVGSGTMGIDVSKWNGSIDWNAVKNSGVNYVIIRVGYRGSSQGALIEDPKFKTNIKGATAAGLKVGVYFFTQAVDEVEAVQEASMVLDRISGYKISYPVFLDVEGSGGRGDAIDSATRTAVCKAFCSAIKNAGCTPGDYDYKTWLTSKMDAGALSGYKIWLAQYAKTPTYTGRYDLWQYRSDGKVSGISGKVDLNISYLGY